MSSLIGFCTGGTANTLHALSSSPHLAMSRLLLRCVLALFFAAVHSAATTVPAAAQGPDGPSGDTGGFEKIDGTKLAPATLSYDATMKIDGRSRALSSTQTFAPTSTGGADTWTLVN
ncbi:hypothetical protein EXE46_16640, partial [Halorubrum sp. GN11_10-6_MGM]